MNDKHTRPEGHDCDTCSEDGHCEIQADFEAQQTMQWRLARQQRIDPRLMSDPPTRSLH